MADLSDGQLLALVLWSLCVCIEPRVAGVVGLCVFGAHLAARWL